VEQQQHRPLAFVDVLKPVLMLAAQFHVGLLNGEK
jgi:hypothetical protein